MLASADLRRLLAELSLPRMPLAPKTLENPETSTWNSKCQEGGMGVSMRDYETIPGTIVFDGRLAMKGYALNKMCFSFNDAQNREEYRRDEDAYCAKFGLTDNQRRAIKSRDVLRLLDEGANIYYLAKWAGIFGWTVQQLGAQQRGISEEAFKRMLAESGGH